MKVENQLTNPKGEPIQAPENNGNNQISGNVIKQVFLIAIILVFTGLICYHLRLFIPSVLGALTLYIISRNFNIYLQETRKWKPVWATTAILAICLVVLILPSYFMGDMLVEKFSKTEIIYRSLKTF